MSEHQISTLAEMTPRAQASATAYDRLIDALTRDGRRVEPAGADRAMAQCPAHDDNNPSLSIRRTEDHALIYCHAGCHTSDVLAAVDLTARDLYDNPRGTAYHYTDPLGGILRTVHRLPSTDKATGAPALKRFTQSGQTKGPAPLLRLPAVLDAVKAGRVVHLVEGEKDVQALEAIGVTATTAPGGASNFHLADVEPLRGARVVAVVDRDDGGHKWAHTVAQRLAGLAESLTMVTAAAGKDASDHVAAGHALADLIPYTPPDGQETPQEDSQAPLRRARITWASQIEPEPVVWAWQDFEHGRIPAGSLSMAAGREGTGKSSFGMWMAAQITRGVLPGHYYGKPLNVLYVALEDSWKFTLVPRLMAAGAELGRVGRFDVVNLDDDEVTLSLPADNELLEDAIRQHEVALVVIDPLMSVIGERIDTHREREVRSALDPLAKIADRTGCVILGIAHFNKGSSTDAAALITGSGAFKNVPRSIFGFARDESDDNGGRVMSQVKNSLGRDDLASLGYMIEPAHIDTPKGVTVTGKFTFTGETDRTVTDVLRESRHGADPNETSERDEAADWLLGYLAERGGEVPAGEAIKAAGAVGIAKTTLTRARKAAKVRSMKSGMTGGWVWSREESTEESEESSNQKVAPSVPSVAPSEAGACPKCLPDVLCIDHWKESRP